jgi:ATP-dependent DNA helicase RecQ
MDDAADAARDALRRAYGRQAAFREGQLEAVMALLKPGARLAVVRSTGWGKSVVYFVTACILRDRNHSKTLVVSPLIALMRNQVEAARRFGLRAAAMHSENRESWGETERQIQRGEADLLFVSPERLHQAEFRARVLPGLLPQLGLVVIDEVHCISEWGHDFRPEYRTVLRDLAGIPKEAAVLGTTATATPRVTEDLKKVFGPFLDVHRGKLARPSLRLLAVHLADRAERLAWLAKYLPRIKGPGLVYASTVYDAMEVARWLRGRGISAEAYHSELGGSRRRELEDAFSANQVHALVATTALGMGYDKADVAYVVHYQLPPSLIAYYQQIGRAGRALGRAHAVLLSGEDDAEIVESFIDGARPPRWVFEQIVRSLAAGPKTIAQLGHAVPVAPSMLQHALSILDSADALDQEDGRFAIRKNLAIAEIEHGEAIRMVRKQELQEMLDYARSEDCRMQSVARALGDPDAGPCGICDRCRAVLPPKLEPADIVAARAFLEGEPKVLQPRWMGPGPDGRLRRFRAEEALLPGIVLGVYGDQGWGRQVREGKYGAGRFSATLVEAAAAALKARSFHPEWLTWVPSSRPDGPLESYARQLAEALGIEAVPAVRRIRPGPPQKSMTTSEEQIANVWEAFAVVEVRSGPCLLVDDIVDSGWTLTAVGSRLRNAGSGPVMPLALAAASTKRLKLHEEAA